MYLILQSIVTSRCEIDTCNALNLCTDTTKCIDKHYWSLKTETVVNQYRTVRLVLVTPILGLSKARNLSSRSQLGVANNVDQLQ